MNSDEEDTRGGAAGAAAETSLPLATVAKLVSEVLPAGFSCAKDAKDLLAECCKEFVLAIASEAHEICEKDLKKTMLPEHILAALKALGFDNFVDEVAELLSEHKELAKGEKQKKQKKMTGSGLSQEEMLRQQEELFAASRARFEQAGPAPVEEDEE